MQVIHRIVVRASELEMENEKASRWIPEKTITSPFPHPASQGFFSSKGDLPIIRWASAEDVPAIHLILLLFLVRTFYPPRPCFRLGSTRSWKTPPPHYQTPVGYTNPCTSQPSPGPLSPHSSDRIGWKINERIANKTTLLHLSYSARHCLEGIHCPVQCKAATKV